MSRVAESHLGCYLLLISVHHPSSSYVSFSLFSICFSCANYSLYQLSPSRHQPLRQPLRTLPSSYLIIMPKFAFTSLHCLCISLYMGHYIPRSETAFLASAFIVSTFSSVIFLNPPFVLLTLNTPSLNISFF